MSEDTLFLPCPKVPPMLRNNERTKDYYDPKLISFGPYHHGKDELQATQKIKTKVMRNFILEHGKTIEDLYIKVRKLNAHARSCYVDGSTNWYSDEEFALMMLQDGCFILFFIECRTSVHQNNGEWLTRRKFDNLLMIYDLGIFELRNLYRDIMLLENQIPFKVLNVLMRNIYRGDEGLEMIESFLNWIYWGKNQKEGTRDEYNEEPVHLLGLLKTVISKVGDHIETVLENEDVAMTSYIQSFGSVSDLQANGINFKPINSISLLSALLKEKPKSLSVRDVDYKSGFFTGELKLPPMILTSDSVVNYTNLIAFEMRARTDFTVISYISFMNSLIESPVDVKVLRSNRIIPRSMSSDEEVFNMLKEISTTNLPQNWSIYQGVRQGMERHNNNKTKIWIAELRHKYFSQPWSVINFVFALIVALTLSFVQTFYTINPRKG